MDRYTVLLVDDEEDVIQVIMKKIDWEALGFSVIGYAADGIKALEVVEEFQPDVVMTDIRMPHMDGMELAGHIKAEFPATKILLLTGFDEFEYAKEAVHLEVEEYILKPVNSAELTGVLSQLKVKLDKEISEKRNTETLQKYYMESLPFLQASFYSTLVEGRVREEDIPKNLSDFQINFSGPCFCCLIVHTSLTQVPEDMKPLLLSTSVQKQAKEWLEEKWRAKCFSYLGNTVLIAQMECESRISELTDDCDRFCRYARHMLGAVVTVGIGHVCGKLTELSLSYESAREAVSYRIIYGTSRAINIKEIAPQEMARSDEADEKELSNLFKMIRLGTEDDVAGAVDQYFGHISSSKASLQQYQIALMEMVSALYRFAVNNEIAVREFSGNIKDIYTGLLDMEQQGQRDWLLAASLSFRSSLADARSISTRSFVARAKEYVRDHYADEALSLDRICGMLGVSNSYFSTVFKKETGSSFTGYLTDYRMDQASRLLIETSEKSYVVANHVGYSDPNYFSYVFKRRFGVSPSRYRTEHTAHEA